MTLRRAPRLLAWAPAVLLAIVLVSGCGGTPATVPADARPERPPAAIPPRLSEDEILAFTRWQREGADLIRRHRAELDALSAVDPSRRIDEAIHDVETRAPELVARHTPLMQAHLDRAPLRGRAAELAAEATGGLFHADHRATGDVIVIARDEMRLRAARRSFGAAAVDDILARESLILAEVRRAGDGPSAAVIAEPAFAGVPGPAELAAFVSAAGTVELGMTESEVSAALGRSPSRRQDPRSPGAPGEASWDGLEGARPGAAAGLFLEGRLLRIEFAPVAAPLPRVERAAAESVTRVDFVQRSVAGTLRLADLEAITGKPAYRATWTLATGFGSKTTVSSRWLWEVEPGGEMLHVDERDGAAGQPVIRPMR